jgi:hypothetical protein
VVKAPHEALHQIFRDDALIVSAIQRVSMSSSATQNAWTSFPAT